MTKRKPLDEGIQAQPCLAVNSCQEPNSGTYGLDIQYKAFREDIQRVRQDYWKQLERTRRVLSPNKHQEWEEYEISNGSMWRNTHLRELSQEGTESFRANREERYNIWLHMHHDAIDALKGHFIYSGYVRSSKNIRALLLDLWNFLPQEFYKFGTRIELQQRQVEWLTSKANLTRRREIDQFLEYLVSKFCAQDKGELTNRIHLFEGGFEGDPKSGSIQKDCDKLMHDMLESGAYKTLVKRLLLQTPLLLWPAVFKPGVSPFLEGHVKPCDVLYSVDGDLVVSCVNMQLKGGYEVYALWTNLLKYEDSARISRCTRAYELRWELVANAPLTNAKAERTKLEGHGYVIERDVWSPKDRHLNAI